MRTFISEVKVRIVLFAIYIYFIVNTLTHITRLDKKALLNSREKFYILTNLFVDFINFLNSNPSDSDVNEFFSYIDRIYDARKSLREVVHNIPGQNAFVMIFDAFVRKAIIKILQILNNCDDSRSNQVLENALEEDRELSLLHKNIFKNILWWII